MLIISSGSQVVAAMFQNDFKEKQEKAVEIKDIKPSVFERMLRFFYTGYADLDNVDVADLLIAANKYGVESLKEDCALHLARNLNVENAVLNLEVSHLHESPKLQKLTLEFMAKNAEVIVSREDWEELVIKNPKLSIKAMKSMVSSKK